MNTENREYLSAKQLEFITPFRDQLHLSTAEEDYLKDSEAAVAEAKALTLRRRNITIALVVFAFAVMTGLTV